MIGFQSPQAEKLDNAKLGGDRGGHTWGRDWSKHRRNMGWCKVSSIHCSDKKVFSVPIRNLIFCGSTIWESTIWESTTWGHQFWIWGSGQWTGSLQSVSLQEPVARTRWTHDGHTVDTWWTLRWTQRWTLVKHSIFKNRPSSSRIFCTWKHLFLGACVQSTVFYQCPSLCPS